MSGTPSPRAASAKRGPSNFGPTDPAEASLSLMIWVSAPPQSSSSTGEKLAQLSKAPLLIRDVPQVRRKLTKRDSKNLNHGTSSGFGDAGALGSDGRSGSSAGAYTQQGAAATGANFGAFGGASLGTVPVAQLEAESAITSARAVGHASVKAERESSYRNPLNFVKSKPGWLKGASSEREHTCTKLNCDCQPNPTEKSSRSRLALASGADQAILGVNPASGEAPMLPTGMSSAGSAGGPSNNNRVSGWRRGTAIFREDGVLSIYGEVRVSQSRTR